MRTPREAEGVDRINVATRPKGRGGGGACSGCPSGWLKVVAVVFARLLNTPATLGNLGGWFVSRTHRHQNDTITKSERLFDVAGVSEGLALDRSGIEHKPLFFGVVGCFLPNSVM